MARGKESKKAEAVGIMEGTKAEVMGEGRKATR